MERAIGEQMDGTPLEDPDAGKNRISVAFGREGGKKGGKATAKRGPDYYSKISAMRKTHGGGRPPKESKPN